MNQTYQILPLRSLTEPQSVINLLSEWNGATWKSLLPECAASDFIAYYKEQLQDSSPDQTFVAFQDTQCIGGATLHYSDMQPEILDQIPQIPFRKLGAWIASVYVDPEHRRHGVWTSLRYHVISQAKERGDSHIFSWTINDIVYQKSMRDGWRLLGNVSVQKSDINPAELCLRVLALELEPNKQS